MFMDSAFPAILVIGDQKRTLEDEATARAASRAFATTFFELFFDICAVEGRQSEAAEFATKESEFQRNTGWIFFHVTRGILFCRGLFNTSFLAFHKFVHLA